MEHTNETVRPLTAEGDIPYIDGLNGRDNSGDDGKDNMASNADVDQRTAAKRNVAVAGDESDGGLLSMCGSCSFPFLLTASVVQLVIYLNKLYQDSAAVAVYFDGRDINYCIVSASCLLIPPLIYIMYLVSVYVKDKEETETKELGTRVVHGLLLVPWQIKGRVEVLHFSAQRICQRRTLTAEEKQEKSTLERQAALLEFFEEFYAGFIQLLLQLYIIIVSLDKNIDSKALPGELVASGLTLLSMMAAVRRKDDGILTGILSIAGWLSIMMSRSVAIAIATTAVHGWMLLICILHGALMSLWISSFAMDSYRQSEPTPTFSFKKKLAFFFLIFSVFGLPSLTYWPIMFQLKKKKRPLIFLLILLLENVLFFCLWYFFRENSHWARHDYALISILVVGYVVGTLFILIYICCKPKYTDEVVYHDMKIQNADSFGMYFDFCDEAFCLPEAQKVGLKLQKVRRQQITDSSP